MITSDERISILRQRCLERKTLAWKDISVPLAKSLRTSGHIESWQERRGLCTRDILSATVFAIDDLEPLAGRLAPRPLNIAETQIEEARNYLKQYPTPGGQSGHCQLHLDDLMQLGLDGLSQHIRCLMANSAGEKAAAYRSFLYALDGLSAMIANAAAIADEAIAGSLPDRKLELQEIADACSRSAHHPPQSFRDAIQLLWFVIFSVQYGETVSLVGPGHIDRVLFHFYEQDLARGKLTRDDALLLIESLYLLLNEFIRDGLAIPVMVGGRDEAGNDITNELSYLCLEALRRTKLVYPTVGICWHEGTPHELIELTIELIGKGYSNPAFFGDETIQKGLKALGVPPEESCNYINSTCVEITPVGASGVWVASPYYNTCGLLLEEIGAQAESPVLTFEELMIRYHQRLFSAVKHGVRQQNELRLARQQHGRKPLQSVFTRDCISRGRDIDDSGALYNWVECSFVGLANLADSLFVIREEVFNQGEMTLAELKTVLDADFEGYENVRQRFLNGYPTYGQDTPDVDALVSETVRSVVAECKRFSMEPDGSAYVPGAFVWEMHERLGRETGATPDGRKAGKPFADGAGPAQGREKNGPTAAILSTTSWDHSSLIGGVAFNMKFNTSPFNSPESFDRLRDLVLTFLRRGGFEVQVNIVDADTLRKARENPDHYRDLVVRIGGYTDYFTRLSPEMQHEIMLRTEYAHF